MVILNSLRFEAKVVESLCLQFGSKFFRSKIRYHPLVIFFYQRRSSMTKIIVYVLEFELDERI